MSVSNPVGSGGGLVAFDRDLQGMAEQMNTVGGWAEIMAQDSLNNTVDEEENKEEEVDKSVPETRNDRSFDRNKVPENPPYSVQIANVPSNCNADDLFLFFGGDEKIADMDLHADRNRANIEFANRDYMLDLWDKSRNGTLEFQGNKLKLFILQNRTDRKEERDSYSRQNSNFQREPYSRQSSRYNSQSSIASDARYDRRYEHRDYGRNDHYGTMPPPGRGYNNDFRGGRGSYRGGRGGNRGYSGPSRGGYYGGDLQRSESYTYDRDRPAPINRSRTDSMGMDRRQSDLHSRTSSQFSLNNDEQKPVVKKPSHSDIFGDAKPVNTMSKLAEIEKKMEEKKQREKAEKEAEKHQQHQQQQQQMMMSHPPPNHNNHPHYAQGGYRPQQYPYQIPPPTYFAAPPVFATPMVPHYGHTHHHPSQYHNEEQNSPRFEGGHVGTVKIMQRSDVDRDSVSAGNTSPPLDPEHAPRPQKVTHPSPIKESATNQSISQDSVKSEVSNRGRGSYRGGVRTFSNSTHKSTSYDGQRGSFRGRGRGGGRGGHHNARNDIPSVAESPSENNNNNKENATGQEEPRLQRENREHHGSQSSLKSRGQGRPSRGRGGGSDRGSRGGYHKERRNRDDRPPYNKDEAQKGDGNKDHRPPAAKKDDEKSQNKVPAQKAETKEAPAKEQQTQKVVETADVTTPTSDPKEKRSKKKKNAAKATVSNMMNGNKFAALLNTSDD